MSDMEELECFGGPWDGLKTKIARGTQTVRFPYRSKEPLKLIKEDEPLPEIPIVKTAFYERWQRAYPSGRRRYVLKYKHTED